MQKMNERGYLFHLRLEEWEELGGWRTWVRARGFIVPCISIEFYVFELQKHIPHSKHYNKNWTIFINPISISSSSDVIKMLWKSLCEGQKGHRGRRDPGFCSAGVHAPLGEAEHTENTRENSLEGGVRVWLQMHKHHGALHLHHADMTRFLRGTYPVV